MIKCKKILLVGLFVWMNLYSIAAEQLVNKESINVGKERIASIMCDGHYGINSYYKEQIKCAETLNLQKDLNIIEIAKYFGCKTISGETFLFEALSRPVRKNDESFTIQKRQRAIQILIENPILKNKIENLMQQAEQEEAVIIKLLNSEKAYLEKLKAPADLPEILKPVHDFGIFCKKSATFGTISWGMDGITLGGFVGGAAYAASCINDPKYKNSDTIIWSCYCSLISAILFSTMYTDHVNAMQKRLELHSLYRFVAISEQIEALCVEYGIDLQSKSTDINDESGINLTRGLKHARYKHKDESIAVITPCVVAFSYEVYENIDSLASIFVSIAEMDAYNAIANKMIEGSSTTNKFCFAQFIDQQKSAIHATEFWNVLVQDKAIVNNLCEDHNIILTGPNAGGKTTSIRAILQNIILTQSFGIAAASDFSLTQFDVIYSYLNISDDLINGLSLFASEVKRAQETLQKIKALESDEKFFFVLDELFTGTAGENGEACAYKFISRIAEFNNIQFIYATHFDKLKELGDKNDAFTNYKINAPIHNDMGKLVYPYTLSAGASNVNVAMQMAEEAGLFD